jgi:two-component system, LytTR family, response regulator LytT
LRFLIVEDEQHIRAELCHILTTLEPCELLEATHGDEALELLKAHTVDAVFLDVNMPGRGGLSVASRLAMPDAPLVVFATASDRHTLTAFELDAVDYLLKPYREARVARTLERIRERLESRSARNDKISSDAPARSNKIWATRDGEVGVLLDHRDIMYFEADDKRVRAITLNDERLLVRSSMRDLEERLVEHFARTHKRYLVNLEHIREVEPYFSGTFVLRVGKAGREKVPLSRQFARSLRERTGWF